MLSAHASPSIHPCDGSIRVGALGDWVFWDTVFSVLLGNMPGSEEL